MILPIRDLVAFHRCSVCEQLKAVERSSAQGPPVGASASRRFPLAAGSGALVREFWQGRHPMLWAHRQYLRLGARPLEVGFGYDWRLLPSSPQTGTSVSGTISASAPSPRACPRSLPVRSSPLCSRKSPYQIRLALPQGGRAHRVRHNHVPGHCQPLTGARPPVYLLSVGQTISGLTSRLTLSPSPRCALQDSRLQHFGSVCGRSQ